MAKGACWSMLIKLTILIRRRRPERLGLSSICLRVEGLLGVCASPILIRGAGCQASILVQLCFPRWGAIALNIVGKEVGVRRVCVDVLTLQRHLVTGHVIGSHGLNDVNDRLRSA